MDMLKTGQFPHLFVDGLKMRGYVCLMGRVERSEAQQSGAIIMYCTCWAWQLNLRAGLSYAASHNVPCH